MHYDALTLRELCVSVSSTEDHMSLADEIEKLDRLKQSGSLSEEEYLKAKASVLRQSEPVGEKLNRAVNSLSTNENTWGMFIHLSQLLGVTLVGYIVPIVLWQVKKNESALIDRHGRIVVNWMISFIIYLAVSFVLSFVIIGYLLMPILAVLGIVFPIIGGIKAANGEAWEYPLSIRFFPTR